LFGARTDFLTFSGKARSGRLDGFLNSNLFQCFALLLTAALLGACAGPDLPRGQFERCLAGERSCDLTLLSAPEQERLFEVTSRLHLRDCLEGRRCNEALLDEPQLRQMRAAVAELNYRACLRGESDCRRSALNDLQGAAVEEAEGQRNFEWCMAGMTACDGARLTPAQARDVRNAYLERNFAGCMNTVGTLVKCNPADLTAEQLTRVKQRNLAINYVLCKDAIFGCDPALLTAEQRQVLGAARR
jgi:hypothetical protein